VALVALFVGCTGSIDADAGFEIADFLAGTTVFAAARHAFPDILIVGNTAILAVGASRVRDASHPHHSALTAFAGRTGFTAATAHATGFAACSSQPRGRVITSADHGHSRHQNENT
jgi:hypothetical protein